MIHEVNADNVNDALAEALWQLRTPGSHEHMHTRNGPAVVFRYPLVTHLRRPQERVLFWPTRDANPFFHLFEALWMLDGRNDVAWPAQFAKQMLEYSDDGSTLAGAYGHRWRRAFGRDQLELIVQTLEEDRSSRRAVLQMWDMIPDLTHPGKDVPCNLSAVFSIRQGALNAYINNRSNDLIWGLYGANAVHFSILLEYLARWLNVRVGTMTTFSVNAHAYLGLRRLRTMMDAPISDNRYASGTVEPAPLWGPFTEVHEWDAMLRSFLVSPGDEAPLPDPFFSGVAQPMYRAWRAWKDDDLPAAQRLVETIEASDWRVACREWMERRNRAQ